MSNFIGDFLNTVYGTYQQVTKGAVSQKIGIIDLNSDKPFYSFNSGSTQVITNDSKNHLSDFVEGDFTKFTNNIYGNFSNLTLRRTLGNNRTFKTKLIQKDLLITEATINTALSSNINVMASEVSGVEYSLSLEPEYKEKKDKQYVESEKKRLQAIIDYLSPGLSINELCKRWANDEFSCGEAYAEVSRDRFNRVKHVYHIPAKQVAEVVTDEDEVLVVDKVWINGELQDRMVKKSMPRYTVNEGGEYRYLKSFSDPRIINPETGEVDPSLDYTDSATELIKISNYSSSCDDLPVWIANLSLVKGLRKAQALNLDFFESNGIPAMMVTVANGNLKPESLNRIKQAFTPGNLKSQHRVIVAEAMGSENGDSMGRAVGKETPQINVVPLNNLKQQEVIFEKFMNISEESIDRSFRIPPIYKGANKDFTRANVETAMLMGEFKVFKPKRQAYCDVFNNLIFQNNRGEKPRYWKLTAGTSPSLIKLQSEKQIENLSNQKLLTVNDHIEFSNKAYGTNLPKRENAYSSIPPMILEEFTRKYEGSLVDFHKELEQFYKTEILGE